MPVERPDSKTIHSGLCGETDRHVLQVEPPRNEAGERRVRRRRCRRSAARPDSRSNSFPTSSRRVIASRVRSRATAERLLATRLTARNANSATQFCGSTIVNVPIGGRKKKLSAKTETIDVVDRDPETRACRHKQHDDQKTQRDRRRVRDLGPLAEQPCEEAKTGHAHGQPARVGRSAHPRILVRRRFRCRVFMDAPTFARHVGDTSRQKTVA